MSRGKAKIQTNRAIEELTARRLREYEAKVGAPIKFPVPVEKVIEQILGLDFDRDEIEEQPGETILGGLNTANRTIVLNTRHQDLFDAKPGLERSTIGHEAGHWEVDIDRARLDHPTFPGIDLKPHVVKRHGRKADRLLQILFNRAMHNEEAYRLLKQITAGQDAPEVRSAVDRYQSALLLPAWLLREAAERYDFTRWPDLYALQEEAQVNISNLCVRLQRLEMIFIPEGTTEIYQSRDEYRGQGQLF
jgi:hypothetical protein